MEQRKLASVQKIIDIQPIEKADKIEVASVLGWKVVVPKDMYKVGSIIVYCEVDSLLPRNAYTEFLFKEGDIKKEFRVRTIRLRGQISQGIIFSLDILGEGDDRVFTDHRLGEDVTEVLGITKYEPYIPAHLQGLVKGNFPSWIPKTDEIRIQSVPQFLDRHKEKRFYITEKLDGASMTVYLKDGEFGVCSRNLDLMETEGNAYWKCAQDYNLKNLLEKLAEKLTTSKVALQGELIGMGVQGNKYELTTLTFKVFNLYDGNRYVDSKDMFGILADIQFLRALKKEKDKVVFCVPLLEENFILHHSISDLIEFAKGKSILNNRAEREGVVFRCEQEGHDEETGRLSFKVVNNNFLEHNKE